MTPCSQSRCATWLRYTPLPWCWMQDSNLRRIEPPTYKVGAVGRLANPAIPLRWQLSRLDASFDILPGLKAGDSYCAQVRLNAAPGSLRWVPGPSAQRLLVSPQALLSACPAVGHLGFQRQRYYRTTTPSALSFPALNGGACRATGQVTRNGLSCEERGLGIDRICDGRSSINRPDKCRTRSPAQNRRL
jgi:hypothetical protein